MASLSTRFKALIFMHCNPETPILLNPELLGITKVYNGQVSVKTLNDLQDDLSDNADSYRCEGLRLLETEASYLINIQANYIYGEGDGDNYFDFYYGEAWLDMPGIRSFKCPVKPNDYDDERVLMGMDVGDHIVTTSGDIRIITDHNMPDLHYSQIKRFATVKEIINAPVIN